MKDAISRVVVEVIKHEWPSKWRSLLHDLFNISQRGVITTAFSEAFACVICSAVPFLYTSFRLIT